MKQLTSKKEGVEQVLSQSDDIDSNELIKNLFDILLTPLDYPQMKMEALQVLKNLLDFGDNPKLENKVI